MKRILIVQTAFVGDVVLTTPLIREIRRSHEDGRITVLTTPAGAGLLEGFEPIDEILVFDKRGADRGFTGTLRHIRRLRAAGFHIGIAAQRSFRTGMLLRAGGVGARIGFEESPGAWAYNRPVPWQGRDHSVRRYLSLAAPAGGNPAGADPYPELPVLRRHRARAEELLREAGLPERDRYVCMAPGSVWGTKRWTQEGYAQLAARISSDGLRVVLAGSPAERPLCEAVRELAGARMPVLAGRTSLPELAALLHGADALVGNDSGPAHIATAVGTPVVAVFGPTVPAFGYTPFGRAVRIVELPDLDCRPCHHHGPQTCPLEHFRCMREIGPETVYGHLVDLLEGRV